MRRFSAMTMPARESGVRLQGVRTDMTSRYKECRHSSKYPHGDMHTLQGVRRPWDLLEWAADIVAILFNDIANQLRSTNSIQVAPPQHRSFTDGAIHISAYAYMPQR